MSERKWNVFVLGNCAVPCKKKKEKKKEKERNLPKLEGVLVERCKYYKRQKVHKI